MEPIFEQILASFIFLFLVGSLIFSNWAPTKIFVSAMLSCYIFGLVETDDVLQKLANPGVMTLAVLLMVSLGLERLNWIKSLSDKLVTKNYYLSLVRTCGLTILASALLNNTAVVATLANTIRKNSHFPASKILIPLSYSAILGGTITLIGTSTNLIVSSFLEDATGKGLAFFDFFIVGSFGALGGLVAMLLTARFLPNNQDDDIDINQYLIESEIMQGSSLINKSVLENGLRDLKELFLVEIVRDNHLISPVAPQEVLEEGDKLIFSGDINQIGILDSFDRLSSFASIEGLLGQNLTEVIVMPNAPIEGKSIKNAGFRALFDSAVVGLHRGGKRLSGKLGEISLQAGDTLMLATGPDFTSRQNLKKNFTVISESTNAPLSKIENYLLSLGLLGAITLSSFDILPLLKGLAIVLTGMLILGTIQSSEFRRRFPFELILIVISALVFAQALNNTGVSALVADFLYSNFSTLGPHVALAGIFLATLLMTEIMTNNAAAALSFPIAFGIAESFGLNYMPFVMAVAYGASASFLTPYGYTTNLMVQNLGGYAFKDYVRAGFPVTVTYSTTVIFVIPIVFPFQI